jgi:SAM-dependent methyltransferase
MTTLLEENFRPIPNTGPGSGVRGGLVFLVRRLLDLQVGTVFSTCEPWLRSRQGTVLEVGCGDQPYRFALGRRATYVGLDLAMAVDAFDKHSPSDMAIYAGGSFPYQAKRFDSVFHTETLEHVKNPLEFLRECARVLRPGGEMCFTVPFQARFHYIPYDYWRFTPTSLRMLLGRAGFQNIRIVERGTDIVVASNKVLGICFRLGINRPWLFAPLAPVIGVSLAIAHIALGFGFGSPDDCLGYTVTAIRVEEDRLA